MWGQNEVEDLTNEVENNLLGFAFTLLCEGIFVLSPGSEDMEINQTRHTHFWKNGGGHDDSTETDHGGGGGYDACQLKGRGSNYFSLLALTEACPRRRHLSGV